MQSLVAVKMLQNNKIQGAISMADCRERGSYARSVYHTQDRYLAHGNSQAEAADTRIIIIIKYGKKERRGKVSNKT